MNLSKRKNYELGYKYGCKLLNLETIAERDGSVTYHYSKDPQMGGDYYGFKLDIQDYCLDNGIEFVKRFRIAEYFEGVMQRFMDDGRISSYSVGDSEAWCEVKVKSRKPLDIVDGVSGTPSFEFGWNSCYERMESIYFDEDDGDRFEFPLYDVDLIFDTCEDIECFEEYLDDHGVEWTDDDDAKSKFNTLEYTLGMFQAYYELGYVDDFWIEKDGNGTLKSVIGHLVF